MFANEVDSRHFWQAIVNKVLREEVSYILLQRKIYQGEYQPICQKLKEVHDKNMKLRKILKLAENVKQLN